jgi:uncharacterized tellurite resistance protein B-like protein
MNKEDQMHEKIQAEIAKLIAETSRINCETAKINNHMKNTDRVEIAKLMSEISRNSSETAKINSENRWYPAIIAATLTLALVAVVKVFI